MIELACGIVQISGKSELPLGKWKFYYCTKCRKVFWNEVQCCNIICVSGECK